MKKLFTLIMLLCIVGGGKVWAADDTEKTTTLNNEVVGYSSILTPKGKSYTVTVDDIIYTFTATSDKQVSINGSSIKFQSGTSFTVSGGDIKKVVFTQSSTTLDFTWSSGSLSRDSKVSTWTGSANSVTFTNGSSNAYMESIVVYYDDTTGPKLTSTIPADGANGQSDRMIILRFNEEVKVNNTDGITISPSTGVTLGEPTVDATDSKKVNISCSGLNKATKYTITVSNDAIIDKSKANNAFAGTSFSFITAITAPTISPNGGTITESTSVTVASDAGTSIKYAWSASGLTADQVKTNGLEYSSALTITPENVEANPYLTAIAYKEIEGTVYYSAATTSSAFADGTSVGVTQKEYPYEWNYELGNSKWGNTATQVAANGSGWSKPLTDNNYYYVRNPSSTGEGFTGTDAVEGLKFTGGLVGLDWGLGHMYIYGTKITIPKLNTTYKVTIKAGGNGTITATNADVDGEVFTPTLTAERTEYTWFVTAAGNVSFTFSGQAWIDYIKVETITKTDIELAREGSWKTVSTYSSGATIDLQMVKVSPTVSTDKLHVTSSDDTVLEVKSVTFGTSSSGRQRIYFSLNVLKIGSSTITITFDGNDRYNAVSYSETFTVNKPEQQLSYATTQITKYPTAEAFTNRLTKTLVKGAITYTSSNTDVATVASSGEVTIVGPGSCSIIATAAATDVYAETSASYSLVVIEEFNYYLKSGSKINPGDIIDEVEGIKLIYGGFTDKFGIINDKNPNTSSRHEYYNGDKTKKTVDKFQDAKTDATGLDGTFYTTGSNNPLFESMDEKTAHTNVRGWDRIVDRTDFLGNNVPVFGTFYVFEPSKDGDLTVSVLQTGAIQDESDSDKSMSETYKILNSKEGYNGGIINKWDYKALYLSDERGHTVQASAKKSYSRYAHPYVFESENLTDAQRNVVSLRSYIINETLDGEVSEKYAYQFTYGETYKNDGTKIEGENSCEKLKAEMRAAFGLDPNTDLTDEVYSQKLRTDQFVHIMENERYGYWTLTKSHNVYTFPVKAGKTYFLYTDGSKLFLNGFSFTPNATASSTLEIDGTDNEKTATTKGAKSNCTVTLNRKLIKDQPCTLMLPFSMSVSKVKEVFGEGTQVLHVKDIDDHIHFVRHHHQMIVAGEPCIIYPTNETGNSWTISNVTVEPESVLNQYVPVSRGGYTFTGCFQKEDMPAGSYWVSTQKGDTQTSAGQDVYIYRTPFDDYMSNTRAFFKNTSGNSNAKLMGTLVTDFDDFEQIEIGDEYANMIATEIQGVESQNEVVTKPTGIYTLNGQKVDGTTLKKGIYIVNGKKVVVK